MSNKDDPNRRRKTLPFGVPVDELASTMPGRKVEPAVRPTADTEAPPIADSGLDSSSKKIAKAGTFPPNAWDKQDHLVTSAKSTTIPPQVSVDGVVTLSGDRLNEALAREILKKAFERAGLLIRADFQFHWGNTLVILDGYDPNRHIGYQYVSHADADVVTDHDTAAEMALKQLAAEGKANVLIVHDVDAPSPGHLMDRIVEFFGRLGISIPTE